MSRPLFAVLALCLCLCGCGKRGAPEFDRLHFQLFEDACSALAQSPPEQSMDVLVKYLDYVDESVFGRSALAHERERLLVGQLNEALASGSIDALRTLFRGAASDGHAFRVLSSHESLPAVLSTLEAYVSSVPFSSSEEAEESMSSLRPFLATLLQSASFRRFWDEQNAALARLVAAEHAVAMDQLIADLDRAAVSGSTDAELLLSCLSASAPSHAIVRAVSALDEADWAVVRDLIIESRQDADLHRALEIACVLRWLCLGAREHSVLGKVFREVTPQSLSGLFLQSWQSASDGDLGRAVQGIRELLPVVEPGEGFVRCLLRDHVLSGTQFRAWCWRSPCPGVADYLTRVEQLRQQCR